MAVHTSSFAFRHPIALVGVLSARIRELVIPELNSNHIWLESGPQPRPLRRVPVGRPAGPGARGGGPPWGPTGGRPPRHGIKTRAGVPVTSSRSVSAGRSDS